jgi:hypothetical protein
MADAIFIGGPVPRPPLGARPGGGVTGERRTEGAGVEALRSAGRVRNVEPRRNC